MERAHVLYSGRVQGVGFRWRAMRCAAGLDVSGFVRNLDDGRVELVAEGERAAVETLLARVRDAMGERIEDDATAWGAATGDRDGFRIER